MLQVYERGITSFVGERIVLRAELWWEDTFAIAGPAKPSQWCPPGHDEVVLVGMGPSIAFPEAGGLIGGYWAKQEHPVSAYIGCVSADLSTVLACTPWPSARVYYGATQLRQGHSYRLEGQFEFRAEMGEGDLLGDSAFVAQSNRPVYWSATFEFRLSDLSELRDPSAVALTSWGLLKQGPAVPKLLWLVPRRTPWSAASAPCRGDAVGSW